MTNKEIRLKAGLPKAAQSSLDKIMSQGKSQKQNCTTKMYIDYGYDVDHDLIGATWLAGNENTPSPFITVGWRWGKADGPSHNFRDDKDEAGISMAEVKGFKKINSFGADSNGRKKHYYIGYIITHTTGGDDELLMVANGKYKARKISKKEYTNYQLSMPDFQDWWYTKRLVK